MTKSRLIRSIADNSYAGRAAIADTSETANKAMALVTSDIPIIEHYQNFSTTKWSDGDVTSITHTFTVDDEDANAFYDNAIIELCIDSDEYVYDLMLTAAQYNDDSHSKCVVICDATSITSHTATIADNDITMHVIRQHFTAPK